MPGETLYDFGKGELNVGALERLIERAAEIAGQRIGVPCRLIIIDKVREFRRGGLTSVILKLDFASLPESFKEKLDLHDRMRNEFNAVLRDIVHHWRGCMVRLAPPAHGMWMPVKNVVFEIRQGSDELARVETVSFMRSLSSHGPGLVNVTLKINDDSSLGNPGIDPEEKFVPTVPLDVDTIVSDPEEYLKCEYYFGDDEETFRRMRARFEDDPEAFKDDPVRLARAALLQKRHAQLSRKELGRLIARRLNEPARLFDPQLAPEGDICEPMNYTLLTDTFSLIRNTSDFQGKEALIDLLGQLVGMGRVRYAENLPNPFCCQRMPDGKFYILVDRSLQWLFEGDSEYMRNLSPAARRAIRIFLGAKLLHETAEILMESEPEVHWELGELDPNIPNTEAAAYRTELRFLALFPDFFQNFAPLINQAGRSLLFGFYREVFEAMPAGIEVVPGLVEAWLNGGPQQTSIELYLARLNYGMGACDFDEVVRLEGGIAAQSAISLAQLEQRTQKLLAYRNADSDHLPPQGPSGHETTMAEGEAETAGTGAFDLRQFGPVRPWTLTVARSIERIMDSYLERLKASDDITGFNDGAAHIQRIKELMREYGDETVFGFVRALQQIERNGPVYKSAENRAIANAIRVASEQLSDTDIDPEGVFFLPDRHWLWDLFNLHGDLDWSVLIRDKHGNTISLALTRLSGIAGPAFTLSRVHAAIHEMCHRSYVDGVHRAVDNYGQSSNEFALFMILNEAMTEMRALEAMERACYDAQVRTALGPEVCGVIDTPQFLADFEWYKEFRALLRHIIESGPDTTRTIIDNALREGDVNALHEIVDATFGDGVFNGIAATVGQLLDLPTPERNIAVPSILAALQSRPEKRIEQLTIAARAMAQEAQKKKSVPPRGGWVPPGTDGPSGRETAYATATSHDAPIHLGNPPAIHKRLDREIAKYFNPRIPRKEVEKAGWRSSGIIKVDDFLERTDLIHLHTIFADLISDDDEKTFIEHLPRKDRIPRINILKTGGNPLYTIKVKDLPARYVQELRKTYPGLKDDDEINIWGHASDRGIFVADSGDSRENARRIIFELLRYMAVPNEIIEEVNAKLRGTFMDDAELDEGTVARINTHILRFARVHREPAPGYTGNQKLRPADLLTNLEKYKPDTEREVAMAEAGKGEAGEEKAELSPSDTSPRPPSPRPQTDTAMFPFAGEVNTIFFDVGGVLLDCDYHKASSVLARYSRMSEEQIYSILVSDEFMIPFETGQITPQVYFERIRQRVGLSEEVTYDRFVEIFTSIYEVNNDAVNIMRQLRQRGFHIYIISSTNPLHKEYLLRKYRDIFEMTDGFIASNEVGVMKNDQVIFQHALREAGIEGQPHKAMFIDDVKSNLNVASTVGVRGILMGLDTDLRASLMVTLQPPKPDGPSGRETAYATLPLKYRPIPIGDPEPFHQGVLDGQYLSGYYDRGKFETVRKSGNYSEEAGLVLKFLRRSRLHVLADVFEDLLSESEEKDNILPHPEGYVPQVNILQTGDKPICSIHVASLDPVRLEELLDEGYLTGDEEVLEIWAHPSDRGLSIAEAYKPGDEPGEMVRDRDEMVRRMAFELMRYAGVTSALIERVYEKMLQEGVDTTLEFEFAQDINAQVDAHMFPRGDPEFGPRKRPGTLLADLRAQIGQKRHIALAKKGAEPEISFHFIRRSHLDEVAKIEQLVEPRIAAGEEKWDMERIEKEVRDRPSDSYMAYVATCAIEGEKRVVGWTFCVTHEGDDDDDDEVDLLQSLEEEQPVPGSAAWEAEMEKEERGQRAKRGREGRIEILKLKEHPGYSHLGVADALMRKIVERQQKTGYGEVVSEVALAETDVPWRDYLQGHKFDDEGRRAQAFDDGKPTYVMARGYWAEDDPRDVTLSTVVTADGEVRGPIHLGNAEEIHGPLDARLEGYHKDGKAKRLKEGDREVELVRDFFRFNNLPILEEQFTDLIDESTEKEHILHPAAKIPQISIVQADEIHKVRVGDLKENQELYATLTEEYNLKDDAEICILGHASDWGIHIADSGNPEENAKRIIFELLRFMGVKRETAEIVYASLDRKGGLREVLQPHILTALNRQLLASTTEVPYPEELAGEILHVRKSGLLAGLDERQVAMASAEGYGFGWDTSEEDQGMPDHLLELRIKDGSTDAIQEVLDDITNGCEYLRMNVLATALRRPSYYVDLRKYQRLFERGVISLPMLYRWRERLNAGDFYSGNREESKYPEFAVTSLCTMLTVWHLVNISGDRSHVLTQQMQDYIENLIIEDKAWLVDGIHMWQDRLEGPAETRQRAGNPCTLAEALAVFETEEEGWMQLRADEKIGRIKKCSRLLSDIKEGLLRDEEVVAEIARRREERGASVKRRMEEAIGDMAKSMHVAEVPNIASLMQLSWENIATLINVRVQSAEELSELQSFAHGTLLVFYGKQMQSGHRLELFLQGLEEKDLLPELTPFIAYTMMEFLINGRKTGRVGTSEIIRLADAFRGPNAVAAAVALAECHGEIYDQDTTGRLMDRLSEATLWHRLFQEGVSPSLARDTIFAIPALQDSEHPLFPIAQTIIGHLTTYAEVNDEPVKVPYGGSTPFDGSPAVFARLTGEYQTLAEIKGGLDLKDETLERDLAILAQAEVAQREGSAARLKNDRFKISDELAGDNARVGLVREYLNCLFAKTRGNVQRYTRGEGRRALAEALNKNFVWTKLITDRRREVNPIYDGDAKRTFDIAEYLEEGNHYTITVSKAADKEAIEAQAKIISRKRNITIEVKTAKENDAPTYTFTCRRGKQQIGETSINLYAHPTALDRTNGILNLGLAASTVPQDLEELKKRLTEKDQRIHQLINYVNEQFKSLDLVASELIRIDTMTPQRITEILHTNPIIIVLPPVEKPDDLDRKFELYLQSEALKRHA